MSEQYIELKGIRVHNLKNIDLKIKLNRLIVITGVSGSGKSSLAFDTLYAEGQRRLYKGDSPGSGDRTEGKYFQSAFNGRYLYRIIRLHQVVVCPYR